MSSDLRGVAVLVFLALFLVVGSGYWVFVGWGSRQFLSRNKALFEPVFGLLQITLLFCMAYMVCFDEILVLVAPPLSFAMVAERAYSYEFLHSGIAFGSVAAIVVFIVLRFSRTRLAPLSYLAAAVAFCAVSYPVAANVAYRSQIHAIEKFAPDCFDRKSLLHSIRISGAEFQHDYHVLAIKDRVLFGWSFREFDFYPIPATAAPNGMHELYQECYGADGGERAFPK